jgi:hypothetical protein
VKPTFKIKDIKSLSIPLSRIKHDNIKITRKGGAGLQRDNNLAGKIQREWTLYHTFHNLTFLSVVVLSVVGIDPRENLIFGPHVALINLLQVLPISISLDVNIGCADAHTLL